MALWQYHTFTFSPTEFFFHDGEIDEARVRSELDQRGEKDWEMIGIFSSTIGQDTANELSIIFKRPIRT